MTDSNLMQPDLNISSDAFKQTESFLDWDQTVNKEDAINDVHINNHFIKLYKKFCPGPITFILKKKIIFK